MVAFPVLDYGLDFLLYFFSIFSVWVFCASHLISHEIFNSCRQGSAGGVIGTTKTESSSQPNVPGNRAISRGEFDNASLPNDRKERSGALDKERGVAKGGNKYVDKIPHYIFLFYAELAIFSLW